MSGVYTPIELGAILGAGASATLYLYTGNLPQCNILVETTVNCQIDITDGYGNAPAPSNQSVPHTLDAAPAGVSFSTGSKSYLSKPKVAGVSATSIGFRNNLCGPWFRITVGSQEVVDGTVSFKGSVL